LPFDRILGEASEDSSAILYADISSPMFGMFHQAMSSRAKEGQNSYRLRYRPSTSPTPGQPLFVNGYGVELVLKRTDYIVIDDRQAEKQNENGQKIIKPEDELKEEQEAPEDLKPLSLKEVTYLGVNAASFALSSDDPFSTLLKLSEDFPKHSSAIAGHNATEEFLNEFQNNRKIFLPAGYNVLWINGVQIDPRQVDAFSLLEHMRRERKLINALKDLCLTASEAVSLVSHSALTESQAEDEPQRYDYRDTTEGGKVIMWLNDIEKDKRYEGWPTSHTAVSNLLSLNESGLTMHSLFRGYILANCPPFVEIFII
jgi:UDP-glucose:glycoprotein glucosyltransferase